ncbi:uncharacterized protein LOC132544439 [Ylistrum balloti]|uniref:uncharacterized protein LOC132544439 n=1 Tax=Ylistrum balloti TaxID=509963 RepID=UPI002905CCAA|nr:uncharacterized protein LOC132544439 [Ylistrum balloti]
MLFVLWISLGLNFFTSAPIQPWLPPNPTDKCFGDSELSSNNTSLKNSTNFFNCSTVSQCDVSSRIAKYQKDMEIFNAIEPQGLDKLYSVSFRWFGAIGTMTAVVLGALVSYFTDHPSADEVDVRYILPLGDQLFPYLPKKARRYLDFGVDFGKRRRWLMQQNTDMKVSTDLSENFDIGIDERKKNDTKSVEAGEYDTCSYL